MSEDTGTDAGGLDSTISNDMFAGVDVANTMEQAYDSQQEAPTPDRGEDGKFVSKEPAQEEETTPEQESTEESDEAEATETEATQDDTVPTREVPIGWDKDKVEDWKAMTEAQQDQFIKRNNQFSAKIQQSVEGKKFADEIRQVEAPYQAMIAAEGANTIVAYQDYLKNAYQLRNGTPEQKVQLVLNLAKTFNVPLNGLAPTLGNDTDQDIYVDPDIQALQQTIMAQNNRIAQMEQRTYQQDQLSQNQEMQSIDSEIAKFSQAEGHEHFDKVSKVMGALMTSGVAEDMDKAYDMAVHADPTLRDTIQASKKKADDTERTRKAQAAAKEAEKTAGTNLKSKGGTSGKKISTGETMEETMSRAYDKAQAR